MENKVKNLAAGIVLLCVMVVAVCADEHNMGNNVCYILAGCALLLAAVLVELEWHGVLDRWDKPAADRRRRQRVRQNMRKGAARSEPHSARRQLV